MREEEQDEFDWPEVEEYPRLDVDGGLRWRAIVIRPDINTIKRFGVWEVFWGTDIFLGPMPFLKSIVLANILVWIAFVVVSR